MVEVLCPEMSDESIILARGVRVRRERLGFEASRAGGPGGQHANTSATRVVLRLPVGAIEGLPEAARARLRRLAGARLTAGDELLIACGRSRSQARNREEALARLRALVRRALSAPKPRRPTRPTRASKERRLTDKRKQREKKARRRPPERD